MTFGAMAAWQGWLLLAGATALAVFIFRLKVRPRKVRGAVAAFLGPRAERCAGADAVGAHPPRRVSRHHRRDRDRSGAGAGLRPSRVAGRARARTTGAVGRSVIVIDSSWSMLARTSGGGTRWSRAIADARRLAAGVRRRGRARHDRRRPGRGTDSRSRADRIGARSHHARRRRRGRLAGRRRRRRRVLHHRRRDAAGRATAGVLVRSVFESADNVGITAFDIRPALGGPSAAGQAYLEIANFGPAQQVHLTLARGDGVAARSAVRHGGRRDAQAGRSTSIAAATRGARARSRRAATRWRWTTRPSPGSSGRGRCAVTVVGEQTEWLAHLFAAESRT